MVGTIELKHLNQCWTLEDINRVAMKIFAGQSPVALGSRGETHATSPPPSLGLSDRKEKFTDLGSAVLRPHVL